MSKRNYDAIGAWCKDAHSILAIDLPEPIAALRSEIIQRYSGRPPILDVARDLAEGLSHLPSEVRASANDFLKTKHGFGDEYFTDRTRSRLNRILARGIIRTEKEHRMVADALTDTTLDPGLGAALSQLVLERERQMGAT
ncbi:hypothetical protein [Lysobacter sp. A289]